MKKRKLHIYQTTCKRCGKAIATANRSLFGNETAKRKWERICSSCITPEEREQMQQEVNAGVFRYFGGKP